MNAFVGLFGIPPQGWLEKRVTTWIVLVIFCVWKWLGVNIVYYLSALQTVPADLYRAADHGDLFAEPEDLHRRHGGRKRKGLNRP